MVLRIAVVLVLGCGAKEQERVVSEATFPAEYADAVCTLQVDCGQRDDLDFCKEDTEVRWADKLERGCFDSSAARDCLDAFEGLDCDGYESGDADRCADVDECM